VVERAARTAGTRDRIAQAALAQVAAGGYASATVNAVAHRAGVAAGSVYTHFPSKADLFAEVFRRAAQREVDAVAGAQGESVRERLAAGVELFVRRAFAAPARAYALIAEPVDPAIEAERLIFRRAYADGFARVVREGVASGELAPMDVDLVAAAIVGALGEALVGPLSTASERDEALIATLVQFCLNAIPEPVRAEVA